MQFTMGVSEEEFFRIVSERASEPFDPMELLFKGEVPVFEKYDEHVPDELVRKGFALGVLDVDGMRETVVGWRRARTRTVDKPSARDAIHGHL